MDLIIVGSGGYASVLKDYLTSSFTTYNLVGYTSLAKSTHKAFADMAWLGAQPGDEYVQSCAFIAGIGDAGIRQKVMFEIEDRGGRFIGLIHPTAFVSATADVHETAIIGPHTFVDAGAYVCKGVITTGMNTIGHDSQIGSYVQFSPFASTMGFSKLGESVFLGPYSCVAPDVSVGGKSKLSSGAIVTRDADAGSLLIGNPAKGRVMFR